MIPKIIHYCWFGGNPLPDDAKKCIASWKRFFQDYEIKEWNESNFDLNCCPYVKEAYEAKKWAFVSDYARFWILYQHGGLYFDTDVEAIKSFDDILKNGVFMGQEAGSDSGLGLAVAPGLGLAASPSLGLYKEILDYYNDLHFVNDGVMDTTTICVRTTAILKKYGYDEYKEEIQDVAGITIYPPEYFCPQNIATGEMTVTGNTHSIHHYSASWFTKWDKRILSIEQCRNKDGIEFKVRRVISLPFRVISKIDKMGWEKTVKFTVCKILKND